MKSIDEIVQALRAPFPKDAVSWRAQTFKSDGTAALALCYIDARDVMNRFDDVCGPFGWSSEHTASNGSRMTCRIGVKNPETGEWVWKSDGAGETDVEGEKGSYSDSLKRAAVLWGVARYLYDLGSVWVPCDAEQRNGKWVFKKWTVDPWTKVKAENKAGFETARQQNARWVLIADEMRGIDALATDAEAELKAVWAKYNPEIAVFQRTDAEIYRQLVDIKENVKQDITKAQQIASGMSQGFNEIGRA